MSVLCPFVAYFRASLGDFPRKWRTVALTALNCTEMHHKGTKGLHVGALSNTVRAQSIYLASFFP